MSESNLGPLSSLVGIWESDEGKDVAPSDDRGIARSDFRERTVFQETGLVDNHEQHLYGLEYQNTAWRIGKENPFHTEMGFWLWDAEREQVMKCFAIPRGISLMAGGTVDAAAKTWTLKAELGSPIYGIASNPFLDEEFKTTAYNLTVTVLDENTWNYRSDTIIQMKGREKPFHHTDQNTMKRVAQ